MKRFHLLLRILGKIVVSVLLFFAFVLTALLLTPYFMDDESCCSAGPYRDIRERGNSPSK